MPVLKLTPKLIRNTTIQVRVEDPVWLKPDLLDDVQRDSVNSSAIIHQGCTRGRLVRKVKVVGSTGSREL